MLSLTAPPQEPMTNMPGVQQLVLTGGNRRQVHSEQTSPKLRKEKLGTTDGQQPPACHCFLTEPLESSRGSIPPSPPPAQVAAELRTEGSHVPMTSTHHQIRSLGPKNLETPGVRALGPWEAAQHRTDPPLPHNKAGVSRVASGLNPTPSSAVPTLLVRLPAVPTLGRTEEPVA